ncbi:CHAT domain-containing protein [Suillus subalutaceus]|uniref:CHAT domain-containing protein n=1 Tax=Suillus subalutaceus TaxID=48586 RepID=UPI001B8671DF|nr:CHAT domain-containing protein [Suillus subalutaceus]KAG1857353.1 CHAT domain-containing protein [Suillus subalutaceus]
MCDQPLSLLDITQTDLSRHEFAFLSACETAVGDHDTPDEVIHLAAGLQFAGVKSVVGTLWNVNDSTVQRLVEAFYKNLCGDGKMNSKRAARALHQVVHSLARDKDMPLDQRIVFMHIGHLASGHMQPAAKKIFQTLRLYTSSICVPDSATSEPNMTAWCFVGLKEGNNFHTSEKGMTEISSFLLS